MEHDTSMQRLEASLRLSYPNSRFGKSNITDLEISSDFDNSHMKLNHDVTLRQLLHDTSLTVPFKTRPAVEALENAFFLVFRDSSPYDALENVIKLIQACDDVAGSIESWNRFEIQNAWLSDEINTWKLLHCLYSDSLVEKHNFLELLASDKPEISQQKLVNILFQSDEELRSFQLMVDWLESCAASQDEAMPAFGRINSNVHWENTLHYLVNSANLFNKESNNVLVTRIDPDACHRQKKNIHALDQQDDNHLCRRIFTEIRCGRFEEAVSLCINSGQNWRGAVLQGWRLLNHIDSNDNSYPVVTGNPHRDLWKLCCMGVLNNPNENAYFKASLGVLCGHLPSVIPVCSGSVEDLLWAHLRVQVECRVDTFLREHFSSIYASTSSPDVLESLQTELKIQKLSLVQIFGCVNSLMEGKVESYYQVVRRHLMLGTYESLMSDAIKWLDDVDFNFVRFLSHFVLILRDMGKEPNREIGDTILRTYIGQLIVAVDGSHDSPELLAYYTSKLPNHSQVKLYAELMSRIEGSQNRQRIMDTGAQAGVDVEASAAQTVREAINMLRGQPSSIFSHRENAAGVLDRDVNRYVLDSLEWLSFSPTQVYDALYLSNNIIRTLIFMNDIEAAASILSQILQLIPVNVFSSVDTNSNILKEHLCLKSYLEAVDAFGIWYRRYVGGRPKSPEPLSVNYTYTDKVHYDQKCTQLIQERARWNKATLHQARHIKKMMYNVLLFPGGWLLDVDPVNLDDLSSPEQDEAEERMKQLVTLRQLCIPEMALLLLQILQTGPEGLDGHIEAIRLANILASEKRALYKVFPKDKLAEVLQKIKDSSLFAMENDKDPWGYVPLH